MNAWLREDLYEFAIEMRKLADTMPAGCEDPLVRLSERMFRYASEQTADGHGQSEAIHPAPVWSWLHVNSAAITGYR